ncbi:MAG: uracil-DNA glycosylase [Planctomycetota bacterium]
MQFDLFDATLNHILTAGDYGEFRTRMAGTNCQRCGLAAHRTQIVVDRGVPKARIMVIGEGPGENEDKQGKAFVGRAGKLFDEIMRAVHLDTNEEMLIANVVKCRPPENRAPRTEEAAACIPFLKKQIDLVKPRVILLLGATSLKHLDPAKKEFAMADEAGKFMTLSEFPGIQFMVLYHPAALLYNAGLKPAMWTHVKTLRTWIDKNVRR